jgi:putative transcription factor
MRTKDVYQDETMVDLVSDFAQRIREARMSKDWKQEELAAKINERMSVIAKLENNSMRPDDQLIKKLEHALNIKLTEKVAVIKPESGGSNPKGLTLGDMIKK